MTEKSNNKPWHEKKIDLGRLNVNSLGRRDVLKTAAATAVSVTGLGAMSGTAVAGGCDYDFPESPDWFGTIDVDAESFHEWPWGSSDLTMFIHGFTGSSGSSKYAYEIYGALRDEGYGGSVVNAVWPAGDSWDDWYTAKDSAIAMGKELARILDSYGWTADAGITVNFVAHSLGGKMALECVRELQGTYGQSINSINLFGAAVWDEQPSERFYDGIRYGTNETHNYYSTNDSTLKYAYQSAEFGRHACGYTGAQTGTPPNWYEHDMSSIIHQHCEYMDADAGCVSYIAANL